MSNGTSPASPAPDTRAAGIAVAAAAILSIIFVAFDQNAAGDTPLAVMESITKIRFVHQAVHAGAIASLLALAFGFASFAWRLGLRRPVVLTGLVAFEIGCMAMVGATLLDGFITPDLAAAFVKASPESVKTGYNLLVFIGIALTDLARLAWVFQAVGTLAWSWALVRDRGFSRKIGSVGVISALVVGIAASASGASISLPAILGILLAQLVWYLAAARYLLRSPSAAPAA